MNWLAQFSQDFGETVQRAVLRIMRSPLEIPGAVESGYEDPSGVLFRLQSGRAPGEVLSGGKRLPSGGDPGPVVWP